MAEEQQGQEKTEEPTQRKLDKAREEGQLARSKELNTFAIVFIGATIAIFYAPMATEQLMALTVEAFSYRVDSSTSLVNQISMFAGEAMVIALPFLLAVFIAGLVASVLVGGVVLAPKAFTPKLSRMNPIKGLGRMFSMKALVELGKSIAKFVLVCGVTIAVLMTFMQNLLVLGALPPESAIGQASAYIGLALLFIASTLIIVAAIDVPFQLSDHKKQLRMTKQEVKDELKDSEGKPEVKSRQRNLAQQVANRKMLDDVPQADVVITNPEHFSVAIRYDAQTMTAPILLAKGVDHMALQIRTVATLHQVPVVPIPVLARAIHHSTQVQDEIPSALYLAVAQVLAYIYQLEQYRQGEIEQPPTLGDVEVPPEYEVNP
ncbi:MAG: flagellar biosynthesis protein FlhB [Pseudomonadota bacterium]